MTLVELIVAMTVTSIVLLGLSSALVVGFHAANQWGQKITEAETVNQLPGWLDQDLHRYVPCGQAGTSRLDLCLSGNPSPRVTYTTSAGACPCTIVRVNTSTGARAVVARNLVQTPTFERSCTTGGATSTAVGWVEVQNLVYQPASEAPAPSSTPQPLVLFFRAPGSC